MQPIVSQSMFETRQILLRHPLFIVSKMLTYKLRYIEPIYLETSVEFSELLLHKTGYKMKLSVLWNGSHWPNHTDED